MALSSSPSQIVPRPFGNERPRRLLAGLVFVVVLLLALIVLPPLANSWADATRARLDDTVLAFGDALNAVENDLQQMQASARGYVITTEPTFLEQYRTTSDSLPAKLEQLTLLAPDVDPALVQPVADLLTTITRWRQEGGDRHITLVQQGQVAEAVVGIASGNSQAIFDSFRTRIGELHDATRTAEDELQAQLQRVRTLQVGLMSGLGILGLLAAGFVIVGFRRLLVLMQALDVERERTAQLAREARAERQRLQAVFDHSPEAILYVEAPDGIIRLTNPAAAELLGPELQGDLSQHPLIRRIFRPGGERCLPDAFPILYSLAHGESCRDVELIVEQGDGKRVPVLMTSVPLYADDSTLQGVVAVVQDLRRLREVERLKSDFVALVSHELRTPLTAIQGCAQTLLMSSTPPTSERVREFMQIIAAQGERLQELIDNLLSLAQVEAGALQLRRALVPVPPLVQGVLRQLRDRFTGLRLQAEVPPDTPPISADAHRIEQVLFNLLDNARKFSPPGGAVTLRVATEGALVHFTVRDQGPGIPPAARERVFERFYQVEQPSTRNIGGTGLGLAICKAIVEAHGGTIAVADTSGSGAALSFTIPALVAERLEVPAPPLTQQRRSSGAHARVLVVDDDPALRRLLDGSLGDAGYEVAVAAEAGAALDAVMTAAPDVILLDVMLPGTDGFALCRQLREWTTVPIIMLTARASEQDVVLALRDGADDYVTKPFRPAELLARIEAALRRASVDPWPNGVSLIQVGQLRVDLARRAVALDDKPIELTPTEYGILSYLARHAGQVLTHDQILAEVWGEEYRGSNQYLWVHIAHLRQKLEPDARQPRYILTERGVGYRLARDV
jgi:PAS domain S-box-containing protein